MIVGTHFGRLKDVRDLVLHIAADAPPPNWLRIDVCSYPIFNHCGMLSCLIECEYDPTSCRSHGAWFDP